MSVSFPILSVKHAMRSAQYVIQRVSYPHLRFNYPWLIGSIIRLIGPVNATMSKLFEKIALLDRINQQPKGTSHSRLSELLGVPRSTIGQLLKQKQEIQRSAAKQPITILTIFITWTKQAFVTEQHWTGLYALRMKSLAAQRMQWIG